VACASLSQITREVLVYTASRTYNLTTELPRYQEAHHTSMSGINERLTALARCRGKANKEAKTQLTHWETKSPCRAQLPYR